MKSIFHDRKALTRLSLFATLGLAIFWGVSIYLSAHGHDIGSSNMQLREHIELDSKAPFVYKTYTGSQNAQELMQALDADYNESRAKTRVSISGKFTAKTTRDDKGTGSKTTTYSSDLTLSEIDARYPRAEWLQLLLDKGITIEDSLEYASLLSKRYTLALLEDNPDLQRSGFLDLPPTDDWETYKAAYIDKLVHDHTKIQKSAVQIERGKKAVERAKAQIEQSQEHAKRAIARSKVQLERAKVQLKRGAEQLERSKVQIEQSQEHAKRAITRSKVQLERAKVQLERGAEQLKHSKVQIEQSQEQVKRAITRSKVQLERSIEHLERAKKELTSQQLEQVQKQLGHAREQLERAKKQLEHGQETLEYPKEPTPPQEPASPQKPIPPQESN